MTEEELDKLLVNPVLSASKASMSYEAARRQLRELSDLLQAKERQITLMTEMFLQQKERELHKQIAQLQEKYEQVQRVLIFKEQIMPEPATPWATQEEAKEPEFSPSKSQDTEEARSSEFQTLDEWAQLT